MVRIVLFLTGFGLSLIGLLYIVGYLNLMTIGYNFLEYVKFISSRLECWNFVLGMVCISFSLRKEGEQIGAIYI